MDDDLALHDNVGVVLPGEGTAKPISQHIVGVPAAAPHVVDLNDKKKMKFSKNCLYNDTDKLCNQ